MPEEDYNDGFDQQPDEDPGQRIATPESLTKEKVDEYRMHAELFAVFEGGRKFEADLHTSFDAQLAKDVQKTMAKLERSRATDSPIIPPANMADAAALLALPSTDDGPTTNDYHIYRRPGETLIVRWLEGEQVDSFYTRLQAHFDVAFGGFRDDEKTNNEWKADDRAKAFLEALDKVEVKMDERYLRPLIQQNGLVVLSTQTADELNISYLADYVMGIDAAAVVGGASAPPEDGATDRDRAWFFKLFSLRGKVNDVERMCFFTFLQKAEDTFDLD